MRIQSLFLGCLIAVTLSTTGFALTTEREVTLTYVREHPTEFSVEVIKDKDGLIAFTINHNVASPMYHLARLAVYREGKLIVKSNTPLFGKRRGNTFHFSIAPEGIGESKFDLSDSALAGSGDEAVPLPGTIIHKSRLLDFVPQQMVRAPSNK